MPQDFNTMQSQAIKYAIEMQKKATAHENSDTFKDEQSNNFNTNKSYSNAFCQSACPINNIFSNQNYSSSDNDIMLLMALLLVLSKDGGDKMLMLALLYIMT